MCHSSHFRQQPICRLTGRRESESEFISFQSHNSLNIKKSNDQKPYTDCLSWVFIWSNICVAFHGNIAERLWNIIYGFGLWFQREESGSAGWVRERRCLWFKLTRTISFLLSLSLLGAVLVWCCCCWPDLVTRFPIYFIFLTVWGGQRTCTFNHRLVANESSKRERERESLRRRWRPASFFCYAQYGPLCQSSLRVSIALFECVRMFGRAHKKKGAREKTYRIDFSLMTTNSHEKEHWESSIQINNRMIMESFAILEIIILLSCRLLDLTPLWQCVCMFMHDRLEISVSLFFFLSLIPKCIKQFSMTRVAYVTCWIRKQEKERGGLRSKSDVDDRRWPRTDSPLVGQIEWETISLSLSYTTTDTHIYTQTVLCFFLHLRS